MSRYGPQADTAELHDDICYVRSSGRRANGTPCPRLTDCVEKVSSSTPRNFLRAAGAVFRERCGGPHRPRPSQSKTRAIDLRHQTNQIEELIVVPANFARRSTFDFFNRIDP